MIAETLDLLKSNLSEEDLETAVLSDEMGAYQYQNISEEVKHIEFDHDTSLIHFMFSLNGEIKLSSKSSDELVVLSNNNFFMFSNPYTDTTLKINLTPGSKVFSMVMEASPGNKELIMRTNCEPLAKVNDD